tara:strand:- start:293 stop:610 length:318 start_codon:yes stop_codon:yes gene_type:complete
MIDSTGGFREGNWEQDKLNGTHCRIFDSETGDLYSGPMEEGKRNGRGRLYDAERDEVYDGDFEMNKRQGEGLVYRRDGEVLKGEFRNNFMEGTFEHVTRIGPAEI